MTSVIRASDPKLAEVAKGIRQRVLGHALKNNGGYMSQACSAAEMLSCMYGGLIDLPEVFEPLLPRKES
jgi:transketolase